MKTTPSSTRPTAHANSVRLMKKKARLRAPTRQISKWNAAAATPEIIPNVISVLNTPDSIDAATYSTSDSGATNMLLRLWDQMFQSPPTVMEYWLTRITSHNSIPRIRYDPLLEFIAPVRYPDTKPNSTTVIRDV